MIDIQQLISALLVALAISLALGPIALPMLRRLKFGQSIREEGPKSHQAKSGTPTMGGIMILIAITVASLIFVGGSQEVWLALFITLGHGVIGFIDDFIKVVLKRNLCRYFRG